MKPKEMLIAMNCASKHIYTWNVYERQFFMLDCQQKDCSSRLWCITLERLCERRANQWLVPEQVTCKT